MRRAKVTPLGAAARGIAAGLAGTAAMTASQEISSRLQASGDESDGGRAQKPDDPWEEASTPAKLARRVIEGVFRRDVPPEWIPALTHGMHWSYGTGWGAVYGMLHETRRPSSRLRAGLAFGAGVWAMSYVELIPTGLYEPPWRYPASQVAFELSYHLVYGIGVAGAYAALEPD